MTTGTPIIEIKFTGDGIRPENVKAGDVAEVIQGVESMVESCVARDHPDVDRTKVIVGLVEIQGASISLRFSSQLPDVTVSAFETIGQAVATSRFSQLPASALDGLDGIALFTRKRRCTADLILHNGHRKVLATLTPETQITRAPLLSGDTIIFGQVVRVGGREPKVMVETVDGHTIYCDASVDVARKLGERLYRVAGLFGLAHWDAQTLVLERFTIKDVTPYEDVSLTEAMQQLAKIAGPYYSGVDDVEQYIATLRGSPQESDPR